MHLDHLIGMPGLYVRSTKVFIMMGCNLGETVLFTLVDCNGVAMVPLLHGRPWSMVGLRFCVELDQKGEWKYIFQSPGTRVSRPVFSTSAQLTDEVGSRPMAGCAAKGRISTTSLAW